MQKVYNMSTMRPLPDKPYMSLREVARYLGLSPRTVMKLIKNGDLLAFQLVKGGKWLIDREALEKFLRRKYLEAQERQTSKKV